MKEHELWFGYLEAGAKSTPVLLDRQLDTANPRTLYLFNLQKGEILEYSREVAEPKLRSLTDAETETVERLTAAYATARSEFRPRGGKSSGVPERRGRTTRGADAPDVEETDLGQDEGEGSEDVLGGTVDGFDEG